MHGPSQEDAGFRTLPRNVKLLGLASLLNDVAALPSSVIFGLWYEHYGALVAFGWGAALALATAILLLGVNESHGQGGPIAT